MLKLKCQYFSHLMQRTDSLEKTLMLGKIEGRRRRGWQRIRWLDGIADSVDMGLSNSGSWWWTGKPGVLQSMESQGVGQDWNEFIFNWRIISLQHCVGFCQTSKWIGHRYTNVPSLLAFAVILKEMGIPNHLTCLLRNLYAGQVAKVRTGHGTTDCFQIGKGVCQGCILSPCFFNFYAEYIMRNAGLDEEQAGIKIAGSNINDLRYANDTTLTAESEEELKSFLMKVKRVRKLA